MTSEPTADVCVLTAERGECRAILGVFASADAAREYLEKRHLGANHYARLLDVRSVGSDAIAHWLSPVTTVEYVIKAYPIVQGAFQALPAQEAGTDAT